MENLLCKIESILFVASKPLSLKNIAKSLAVEVVEVEKVLEVLKQKYNEPESGINIMWDNGEAQMVTNPENAEDISGFIKDETAGELTKAQLETLTVIAYRGPITRPELEQIRGVNCAIIIRLLLIRGLIEEVGGSNDLFPSYVLSFEALRHLGVKSASELPNYGELNSHQNITNVLDKEEESL